MLIENSMVKEFHSGGCIPCIPGIIALNRPLAAKTRAIRRGGQETENGSSWSYNQ